MKYIAEHIRGEPIAINWPPDRPLEELDILRPNHGVDALHDFLAARGGISWRDRVVLARMLAGDERRPVVAGANRFAEPPSYYRAMIFRQPVYISNDEAIAELGVARVRFMDEVMDAHRSIEENTIVPLLRTLSPQTGFYDIVVLSGSAVEAATQRLSMTEIKARMAVALAKFERRLDVDENSPQFIEAQQFTRVVWTRVDSMNRILNCIDDILLKMNSMTEAADYFKEMKPELHDLVERWYVHYLKLSRIAFRMELSKEMKLLEDNLVVDGFDRAEAFLSEDVHRRWQHRIDAVREAGFNVSDEVRGALSDLRHYIGGTISKPIYNIRMLKDAWERQDKEAFSSLVYRWKARQQNFARGIVGPVLEEIVWNFGGDGVEVNITGPLPEELEENEDLLMSVVNVLYNALKYTPEGLDRRIVVNVDGPKWDFANRIVIEDNGPGISEERQLELKLNESSDKVQPVYSEHGSGRGLYDIRTRLLPRLKGVSMEVNSVPGRGTRVTFILPVRSVRGPR